MKITMMYMGIRVGAKGKAIHEWLPLKDDMDDGTPLDTVYADKESRIWVKQLVAGAKPGMMYEFEAEEVPEGQVTKLSITIGSEKYLKKWSNRDDLVKLEVTHKSQKASIQWNKKAAKDARERVLVEYLEPIRHVYWKLTPTGRSFMLAHIIHYITQGGI
jgi:hypothetical protein